MNRLTKSRKAKSDLSHKLKVITIQSIEKVTRSSIMDIVLKQLWNETN